MPPKRLLDNFSILWGVCTYLEILSDRNLKIASSKDCLDFSENNRIKIWNNGKGIPVVQHKTEKMYVPTMIFGHLLTSSNYDDSQKKVTGK